MGVAPTFSALRGRRLAVIEPHRHKSVSSFEFRVEEAVSGFELETRNSELETVPSTSTRIRTLSDSFGGCLLSQEHTRVNHRQEVRRESNPPFDLHRVACCAATPLTSLRISDLRFRIKIPNPKSQIRNRKRKERESNPQGLSAHSPSKRAPSPVGLPFLLLRNSECGIRNENQVRSSIPHSEFRIPQYQDDPGWNRTTDLLLVTETP